MIRNFIYGLILALISCFTFAADETLTYNPNLYEKIDGKYALKSQLLVALRPGTYNTNFNHLLTKFIKKYNTTMINNQKISSKFAKIEIIKIHFNKQFSIYSLRQNLKNMPGVLWVQPNYIYNIDFDPRESTPNDPLIGQQYHHTLMNNFNAWDISTGNNVLIAVTDDGFDMDHEDLSSRFIANKAYNVCENNDKVYPKSLKNSHGTHVSGILSAELDNGVGVAGVAGKANLLPIKFYSNSCEWTSDLIYRAYQYAVDNGAAIISTSYNIDKFVGDEVFVAALDYAYDRGVLHFNSAGNNNQLDPPRVTFPELIFVANTDENDQKSHSSNYGKDIQISAPGDAILSTVQHNRYEFMSGTSMATPNAAGVAALIWSAHPSWTRDQVAAQLIGTTDNIDDKNPDYQGMLGTGRVNSYRALTEVISPPKISEVILKSSTDNLMLAIHFDKLLDPAIVNQKPHWEIRSLEDASIIHANLKNTWYTGLMTLQLILPKLPAGNYQLTVKDSLKDPFGQALDGKNRGTSGGDFVYHFMID